MKILHLANHCKKCGNGIVNVAIDLACYQGMTGHAVAFASAGGDYEGLLALHAVNHTKINQRLRSPFRAWKGLVSLFDFLRDFRPDIVHAHMVSGFLMAKAFQPFFRYKLISTMHNEFQRSTTVLRFSDRVIAISGAVEAALKARRFDSRKLALIRNGVLGSPRVITHPSRSIRLAKPAIITAAGLYARKGIADLLRAFDLLRDLHPSAHLYVLGEGPQRQELVDLASSLSSGNRIHFEGFVSDPENYFRAADVFVLASHNEPFGLVLTEAMEQGCATIGTDVGGISEVLEHGRAGLLVNPAQPQEIAAALDRLLGNEDQLKYWKEAARGNIAQYSYKRMGRETVSLYQQVLQHPSGEHVGIADL